MFLVRTFEVLRKGCLSVAKLKIFGNLSQAEILILDEEMSREVLLNVCSTFSVEFFDSRRNKIFLKYFLKALFKSPKHSLNTRYFNEILIAVSPKVCIAPNEYITEAYSINKLQPGIKVIIFTTGTYFTSKYRDDWDTIMFRDPPLVDYFVVNDQLSANYFSEIVKTTFMKHGNLRLNSVLPFFTSAGCSGFGFVSEYRPPNNRLNHNKQCLNAFKQVVHLSELFSKPLKLAPAANRPDKSFQLAGELKAYRDVSSRYETSSVNNLIYLSSCEIIFSLISQAGLDLLSVGKKVFFFDVLANTNDRRPTFFSELYGKDGPFWDDLSDIKRIETKVHNIISMSEREWQELLKGYLMPIEYFDYGNEAVRKDLRNIIKTMEPAENSMLSFE